MTRTVTTRPAASGSPTSSPAAAPARHREGHRETVEALVVAFILALLVRGFAAEAFVIPTGSMAPTLMGRHKEVVCPQCHYVYTVNASTEEAGGGALGIGRLRFPANPAGPASMVVAGTCVNCR